MPIRLEGRLICANATEAALVRHLLPAHIALTRSEPGCLSFSIEAETPFVWHVTEAFRDQASSDAHQRRTSVSPWGRKTAAVRREYRIIHG